MSQDQDIIDTIAETMDSRFDRAYEGADNHESWSSASVAGDVLAALRSAGYEVVARPESLPLAALHEAMVAYDAYPSENAEDDYNPCMRVLDAARDFLDAEKARWKEHGDETRFDLGIPPGDNFGVRADLSDRVKRT